MEINWKVYIKRNYIRYMIVEDADSIRLIDGKICFYKRRRFRKDILQKSFLASAVDHITLDLTV